MALESLDNDIVESTERLINIIKKECEKSPSGVINGYLVPNPERCIIQKKEVHMLCITEDDSCPPFRRGSIVCNEPLERIWTLAAMVVAYNVVNRLRAEFKDCGFKKFSIQSITFCEYKYDKRKILRYRKTDYEIPFFKVCIRW
ncbi:MAG: hypothetical protein NC092_01635 [Butyrivibrio sp.]|nr:hypothetical protein [Muribaculum sp.]MCM1551376.1 hypothetical protein [Butyrivibrio sp.]